MSKIVTEYIKVNAEPTILIDSVSLPNDCCKRYLHRLGPWEEFFPNYIIPSPNPLGTNKHVGAGWRKLRVDQSPNPFCSPQRVGADFPNHVVPEMKLESFIGATTNDY